MGKKQKKKKEGKYSDIINEIPDWLKPVIISAVVSALVTLLVLYITINSFIIAQPKLFMTSDEVLHMSPKGPHYELELQNIGKKPLPNVRVLFWLENETSKEIYLPSKTLPADMERPITVILQPENFENMTDIHIFSESTHSFTPPVPEGDNLTVYSKIAILKPTRLFVKVMSNGYIDQKEFTVPQPIIFILKITYTEEGARDAKVGAISPINCKVDLEKCNVTVKEIEHAEIKNL